MKKIEITFSDRVQLIENVTEVRNEVQISTPDEEFSIPMADVLKYEVINENGK